MSQGAHNEGEVTWRSKQRTRFAFGTTATPRMQRDFTPKPFLIHPLTRCTLHRGITEHHHFNSELISAYKKIDDQADQIAKLRRERIGLAKPAINTE
jgi:hypothetical protein